MSVLRTMMILTLLLTAGLVQAASIRLPDGAVLTTPGGVRYAIPAGSVLEMPDAIPRPPTAPYDPRQVDTLDWMPLPPTAPFYDPRMPEPPTAPYYNPWMPEPPTASWLFYSTPYRHPYYDRRPMMPYRPNPTGPHPTGRYAGSGPHTGGHGGHGGRGGGHR